MKITSFYPDTFWLGLKSQVGNNIRFWEVVLPVSASAISIAGGMLYLQVLWDFSLCLPYPGVYPLCSMGSFHLETHISHYSGIHLLLISSSMRLTLIFRCSFFILYIPFFSPMGQCCGCSTVCSQAVAGVIPSFCIFLLAPCSSVWQSLAHA